jgi:hypothetical protein
MPTTPATDRVTVDTVQATLARHGLRVDVHRGRSLVRYRRITAIRPGVVRIQVAGITRARRKRAQLLVCSALRDMERSAGWDVLPVSVSAGPWRTWVTVTDPERDRTN